MHYGNLKIISQPAWKVVIVDALARLLGILVKVDGIPIGSSRNIDFSHTENHSGAGAVIGGTR